MRPEKNKTQKCSPYGPLKSLTKNVQDMGPKKVSKNTCSGYGPNKSRRTKNNVKNMDLQEVKKTDVQAMDLFGILRTPSDTILNALFDYGYHPERPPQKTNVLQICS